MSTPTQQLSDWLSNFGAALEQGDLATATDMFADESYWRDLVSFTWNIKTVEGKEEIQHMLEARNAHVQPSNFQIEGEANEADGVTDGWFTFETGVSQGKGQIRLLNGKCWTLLTTMVELKGHEEAKGPSRPQGVEHGAFKERKNWLERKQQEEAELGYTKQPYCVIIGGGQGGIGLGARLRRLGVPTIIIEKNERAGDSWRKRYKSLCLHDPVWYDHMPYLPFPDHWPVFSPKDKLGDWLEMYTKIMELNYWSSTECTNASYDEDAKEWMVKVTRGVNNGSREEVTLRPKQLILATGMSGMPNVPEFPGADTFKGDIHHSSQHGDSGDYSGKKAVVIGSNNSAHDICAALWENGADVTMVQRSSTHIARSNTLMELALGDLYSERAMANGVDHHMADLIFASIPYRILHSFQIPVYEEMARQDADFYKGLEDAGFLLDFGEDGSGLFMKYLRRGSGYYIDVGASQLIIDGKVKLKSGENVEKITENSVVLTDGTELEADLIVLATGYGSMNGWAAKLISPEVADKVGKCWGLGSDTLKDPGPWEGEQRNMWKPTQQEALWFHGGNLHQSRHYSQFLSLQIKARMEGIPTPVYGLQGVHHLN
ncbi:MAG: NAD(P)/FAD-dependent oxidoreductase [Chloroflexota bacterium]